MNRETRNENRGAHGLGWVCTENREARNVRRPTFQPGPGTRTQKQEMRNLWLEIFGLSPWFCHEKQEISGTSEFCRACFGICAPELETPVWNLRVEFCSQFNEIAISDNEGNWLAFFAPGNQNSEARAALDRSSVLMRRPARAGRKDAPIPPTPNPHQTVRARAATAAQLAASAVGPTAGAARQPRSSPRKAGVQPGLHVWAYDVPRAACASSGALKRWLAADVATFASIYMELRPARLRGGFLRVCHLHFDLDGRSAGSTPCLRRRRGGDGRVMRAHFSIPNPNSRFSFHRGLAVRVIPHFCVQITE